MPAVPLADAWRFADPWRFADAGQSTGNPLAAGVLARHVTAP
jgi:hypothetical protein